MSLFGKIKKTVVQEKAHIRAEHPEKKEKKKEGMAAVSAGSFEAVFMQPWVTEKASLMSAAHRTWVFKVAPRTTASEVKKAVERTFGVTVTEVRMANMPGKKVRVGMREGKVPGFRKAMVTLKEGDKIDIGV